MNAEEARRPDIHDLRLWVQEEQANLWDELVRAIDRATNGVWSMEAAWLAQRIVGAVRLVGPTPPDAVPWRLAAGGVYDAVLSLVGPFAPVSLEYLQRAEEIMADHGGRWEALRATYVPTVAALLAPDEAAAIRDEGDR